MLSTGADRGGFRSGAVLIVTLALAACASGETSTSSTKGSAGRGSTSDGRPNDGSLVAAGGSAAVPAAATGGAADSGGAGAGGQLAVGGHAGERQDTAFPEIDLPVGGNGGHASGAGGTAGRSPSTSGVGGNGSGVLGSEASAGAAGAGNGASPGGGQGNFGGAMANGGQGGSLAGQGGEEADGGQGGRSEPASCGVVGSACEEAMDCVLQGTEFECKENRCIPVGRSGCGGFAGATCDIPPWTVCAIVAVTVGFCFDPNEAECVCRESEGLACY
jgi:hypothetical protein